MQHVVRRNAATILMSMAMTLAACDAPPSSRSAPEPPIAAARGQAQAAETNAGKRLAISHAFVLRLPSRDVESIQNRHLEICARLGCTVLKTSLNRYDESQITAETSVRIAPEGYSDLAAALAMAPVVIVSHSQTAEDHTLPLLDVEKRLEIKATLRGRLAAILGDPAPKSAADLAGIEKEIAQVQGDIEAITAQRDHLLTITETVKVDIRYFGTTGEAGGFDVSRIENAVNRIGDTVIGSVATLISFVAALVPWLPVIALITWLALRVARRWRLRRTVS